MHTVRETQLFLLKLFWKEIYLYNAVGENCLVDKNINIPLWIPIYHGIFFMS